MQTTEDPGTCRPSHQHQHFTCKSPPPPSSGRVLTRLLQVVPNQVEVDRCGGSCPSDNHLGYERCSVVEQEVTRLEVVVQVLREGGGVEQECKEVTVETHTACRCGCQQLNCTSELQVESYRQPQSLSEDLTEPMLQRFDPTTCECECLDPEARGQCLVQNNKVSSGSV